MAGPDAMTDLALHFAPNTCALVTMMALEETGQPYQIETVAFMRGDHRSAAFLELNPKGCVPVLVVDGVALTENVAILSWLARRFPEARLLPSRPDDLAEARVLADLAFCASGLHPLVTRLRIPHFFCDMPGSVPRVFAVAEAAMHLRLAIVEQRLSSGDWWYGDTWSVIDAYLNWVWFRATGTAFDAAGYPAFARHDARMRARSAVRRAYAHNDEIEALLAAQGLEVRFSGTNAVAPAAATIGKPQA